MANDAASQPSPKHEFLVALASSNKKAKEGISVVELCLVEAFQLLPSDYSVVRAS